VDVRTLFLAQTCVLVAAAAMLWIARSDADRRNGLRTWTLACTCQAFAYVLLANAGRLPTLLSAVVANGLGAASVALFFAALRQLVGQPVPVRRLSAMVAVVTAVAAFAGTAYGTATAFNGVVYGAMQFLNARLLWRAPAGDWQRVQRVVAAAYGAMGVLLPLRAAALALRLTPLGYLDLPAGWQAPIYLFGLAFIVVTNLGFVQMCKIRVEADVRRQAMTDDLTGLANRRALDAAMSQLLAAAQRNGRPFAVVMVDLDHFKAVNDRYGHRAGDDALVAMAFTLRAGLRVPDLPFRYGGEEFCLLLPDTDADGAHTLAERLRERVAEGGAVHPGLTASFGVALWAPGDTADALFGRADQALYRAKATGRDRVVMG
jgi:diguanylate cyclase (GGDEF)-like protein